MMTTMSEGEEPELSPLDVALQRMRERLPALIEEAKKPRSEVPLREPRRKKSEREEEAEASEERMPWKFRFYVRFNGMPRKHELGIYDFEDDLIPSYVDDLLMTEFCRKPFVVSAVVREVVSPGTMQLAPRLLPTDDDPKGGG